MRFVVFALLFSLCITASFADEPALRKVNIALIADGNSDQVEKVRALYIQEINDLLEGEFEVTYAPEDEYTGDWKTSTIHTLIDKAFSDPSVDMIVMIGVIGSDLLSTRKNFPKPTFASIVIDESLQKFPEKNGTSGVHNFSYLRPNNYADNNIKLFLEITPFEKLAVLIDAALIETIPEINQSLQFLEEKYSIDITLVPVSGSINELVSTLKKGDFDAVYIAAISSFDLDDIHEMIKLLIELKLPSFAHYGIWMVYDGVLATTATELDSILLSRRVAVDIQNTLLGEDPKDFKIQVNDRSALSINMDTARKIAVSVPLKLLLETNLIHALDDTASKEITFMEAVYEMLNNNLELAISEREVYSGREDVNIAKSRLRPHVDFSTLGRIIDRDRAIGAVGREPQSAMYAEFAASQVVYDNELYGDVKVQTHIQCARVEDYFRRKLDVIFELAVAYLNYLRNRGLQEIRRNNLKLTRSNLDLAKQRVQVGVARYSEIYRWESEIATNQTSLVRAFYDTDTSRIRLNKIMNRPQTMMTLPVEVSLSDPYWLIDSGWYDSTIQTYSDLEVFKNFSVLEGMTLSPEIKELVQQVRAQAERLGITNRALWQPSLALIGEWSDRFAEGGAGTVSLPPKIDSTDWLVGFSLNFPLYEGGAKFSRQRRAFQTLMGLKLQLKNLAQLIEESIRVNINRATASFTAIRYAENSAVAAKKNLELVTEQYSRGLTNIVDLIDAQNQALDADLTIVNANYGFLIDAVAVQRAIGRYDFMMSDKERIEWFKYLNIYLQKHKVKR